MTLLYDQIDILHKKCCYQNIWEKREQYIDLIDIRDKVNACNLATIKRK